jgi:hypothetical protein
VHKKMYSTCSSGRGSNFKVIVWTDVEVVIVNLKTTVNKYSVIEHPILYIATFVVVRERSRLV